MLQRENWRWVLALIVLVFGTLFVSTVDAEVRPKFEVGKDTGFSVRILYCDTFEQAGSIMHRQEEAGYQIANALVAELMATRNDKDQPVCGIGQGPITIEKVYETMALSFPDRGKVEVNLVRFIFTRDEDKKQWFAPIILTQDLGTSV